MAATFNIDAYSDALVVLGTAGIVVPLVRRFGLSPVLGYLGAGAILGPLGLGTFKEQIPALYWLTVVDASNVSALRRARHRVPAVPDRARAVLPAPADHAPAGVRARQPAGRPVDGRHRRHRRAGRQQRCGLRHHRLVPGPVVDRDRAWRSCPTSAACRPPPAAPAFPSCWRRIWPSCRSCCSCPSWANGAGRLAVTTGLALAVANAALALGAHRGRRAAAAAAAVPPGGFDTARASCSWRRPCSSSSAPP